MRSDFNFWQTISTRWNDMDPMNHVNSATYFIYFEMVRMAYFEMLGLSKLKVQGKRGPAVISQTCNYRQQVFHPSTIDAGIRSTEVNTKTFIVEYEFYLTGTDTLVCDGKTIMAWVDYENPKAIPVPEVLREAILAYEKVAPAKV